MENSHKLQSIKPSKYAQIEIVALKIACIFPHNLTNGNINSIINIEISTYAR